MKKIGKAKRHFMVLALSVSFLSLNMNQTIGAVSSSPTPAPSSVPANNNKSEGPLPNAKPMDIKSSDSPTKFDISKGFSTIAEKAIMAVVNVSTTQVIEGGRSGKDGFPQFAPGSPFDDFLKEFFDQMERSPRKVQSLGSGFIIQSDDKSATIVTNYHVIADAKEVSVFLNDNTKLEATVSAYDERTDIAILKVKTDGLPSDKRMLPTLEWGDSHAAKVGDWILAIGNPFGLGSTVTSGIISNRARNIMMRSGGRSPTSDYVDDFMQHDAAINMGNSGGPLLSLDGKVIGINTAIYSPSGGNVGIGFAIPSSVAQDTVNQLLKFGRTKRAWLGVRIQPVTDDIAESLGLGKARGAIIGSVTPDSPASKAKIEPEDIILEFDGKEVNEKKRLDRLVGETPVGKGVKVKVWRKGKEMTFDVVLGDSASAPDRGTAPASEKAKSTAGQENVLEVLGIKLSALTPELKERFKLSKDVKGIMVMRVDPNSTAVEIGLRGIDRDRGGERAGDIIEKVNQQPLTKPEEFAKAIEEAKKENRKNVLLLVSRDGDPRFVPLKLENEDLKDRSKDKDKDTKK